MTIRTEEANGVAYRYSSNEPPRLADRTWAVLRGRSIDEITREAVPARITTRRTGLAPRHARDGLLGLIGVPQRLFPLLATTVVTIDCRVAAPGYLPADFELLLGPQPGFPGSFLPINLNDVELHRRAVVCRGRAVRGDALGTAGVAGATISLSGYWRTFPAASVNPATVMEAANVCALTPPVYARRNVGAQCRMRALMQGPEIKRLLEPAVAGATRLRVSDRLGLSTAGPGNVLVVDFDGSRREYMRIAQIATSSSPDQSASITLAHPLAHTHLASTRCRPATAGAPAVAMAEPCELACVAGASLNLSREAIRGDETIFLSGPGIVAGVVELFSVGGVPELHDAEVYTATSDANGFFRLPPLSRVAMVQLTVAGGVGAPPPPLAFAPDYRDPNNLITLTFQ